MGWVRSPKDFWSGVLFIAFGIVAIAVSGGYHMGTAARMGPGYFPRGLGWMLVILGAFVAARGVRVMGAPVAAFKARPIVFVLGAVVGHERGEIIVEVAAPLAVGDGIVFEPTDGAPGPTTGFAVAAVRTIAARDGITRQAIATRSRVSVGARVRRTSHAAPRSPRK